MRAGVLPLWPSSLAAVTGARTSTRGSGGNATGEKGVGGMGGGPAGVAGGGLNENGVAVRCYSCSPDAPVG